MLSMRNTVVVLALAAPGFAALEIQAPSLTSAIQNPAGAGNVIQSAVSSIMSIQTHATAPGAAANAPIATASATLAVPASGIPAAISTGGNAIPTASAVPGNGTDAGANPTLISVPGITSDMTASAPVTAAPFPTSGAGGLLNSNTTIATAGSNNHNNSPSNATLTDSADPALLTATPTSGDDFSNSSATTLSTSTRSSTASPSASNATKAKSSHDNAAASVSAGGRMVWTMLATFGLVGFMLV